MDGRQAHSERWTSPRPGRGAAAEGPRAGGAIPGSLHGNGWQGPGPGEQKGGATRISPLPGCVRQVCSSRSRSRASRKPPGSLWAVPVRASQAPLAFQRRRGSGRPGREGRGLSPLLPAPAGARASPDFQRPAHRRRRVQGAEGLREPGEEENPPPATEPSSRRAGGLFPPGPGAELLRPSLPPRPTPPVPPRELRPGPRLFRLRQPPGGRD